MKKLFFLLIAIVAMASCNSDTDEFSPESPEFVKVSLTPSFSSGYITRAENLYSQIYYKIQKADSYSLVFTETTTGKTYTFTGNWGDSILIKSGKYKVVGASTAYGDVIQEKCSLKFDTEINIKTTDTSIILQAQYDCFLLLFDKNVINKVSIFYGINYSKVEEKTLFERDNIIYCFSKKLYNENGPTTQCIVIYYADNTQQVIYTRDKVFEIGKYYSWDGYKHIKNSVSIPWMTQGDI